MFLSITVLPLSVYAWCSGEDFDHNVLEYFQKDGKKLGLPDFTGNGRATRRLMTAIERVY